MQRERLPSILIPLAAFIAILPLLLWGCSCGHDFDFHILNWIEAARQFTHGNLHPHWAYTPAWNAGEPRFVFYPPLSWNIGAVLGLLFPWTWAPILYTWLVLTASGLALHRLARNFASPAAALIAAVLYIVNPYMLFTAYERTAYAELLAAAWIPLLLHAILRKKVTIPRIAVPVALLWLTNAPAAVMSCYALALLTVLRLMKVLSTPTMSPASPDHPTGDSAKSILQQARHLALTVISGTTLGLGVAAFYILPAAYERRYVQIAMAIIPFLRIQDNFLFHHTSDAPHDQVLHTASVIAVILIAATAITLIIIRLTTKPAEAFQSQLNTGQIPRPLPSLLLFPLTTLTAAITLLLTPLTSIVWNHTPELSFLQFPWRLVAILAAVLALSLALALASINLRPRDGAALTILIAAALVYPAYAVFHQTCDEEDTVSSRLALFRSNQGSEPTDEYTTVTADNDALAHANPSYWLSPDPDAKPPANSQPNPAPTRLILNPPAPQNLTLNLRNYPSWHITRNGTLIATRNQRDDGLISFPVPAGPSTIDITYAQTVGQTLGDVISAASVVLLLFLLLRHPNNVSSPESSPLDP
jgi:hypothetical protein